jgi:3-deoxy-7-phosphoheptulonate synthase
MVAAGHPHSFLGICADGASAVVSTRGNPDRHIVLRGGTRGTNYDAEHVAATAAEVRDLGIARPVMVDCSHGNSGKDPARQLEVAREVLAQVRSGPGPLAGLMLESNLEAGSQTWSHGAPLRRGVSITDACMGWSETEDLLYQIAEAVKLSQ